MSVRKPSHGTIFLIVSSGSPRALIASSLRSTSKKPFCPMTRSLHPPITACGHRVRFVATWREEFFEVPLSKNRSPSMPTLASAHEQGLIGFDVPELVCPFPAKRRAARDRAQASRCHGRRHGYTVHAAAAQKD